MQGRETFSCEIREGRLIEARVHALKRPEEARAYSAALGQVVQDHIARGGGGPVLCADHRPVVIYAPAVADELARLFGQMNAHLQRVAIIAAKSNATLVMQLGRIIREAGNPKRQLFYAATDVTEFLAGDLDSAERARAQAFLAELPSGP